MIIFIKMFYIRKFTPTKCRINYFSTSCGRYPLFTLYEIFMNCFVRTFSLYKQTLFTSQSFLWLSYIFCKGKILYILYSDTSISLLKMLTPSLPLRLIFYFLDAQTPLLSFFCFLSKNF